MATACPIQGIVYKGGSAILLARVLGADAAVITQASIASAVYSIYEVDEDNIDSDVPVTGHDAVTVLKTACIFDTLQTDDLWDDLDATGYNFKHVLDVSSHAAFPERGVYVRVRFSLTPAVAGQQVIPVEFKPMVI